MNRFDALPPSQPRACRLDRSTHTASRSGRWPTLRTAQHQIAPFLVVVSVALGATTLNVENAASPQGAAAPMMMMHTNGFRWNGLRWNGLRWNGLAGLPTEGAPTPAPANPFASLDARALGR